MEELMDLMVSDESPSQVSDQIKDLLFAKTAEKIEAIRPNVAVSIFDEPAELEAEEGEAFDTEPEEESESE